MKVLHFDNNIQQDDYTYTTLSYTTLCGKRVSPITSYNHPEEATTIKSQYLLDNLVEYTKCQICLNAIIMEQLAEMEL